ncbi:metallophosphoesterase family protein [Deinococcus pimensis]|uniref:metallophosphoesterase family protein n=1 Tax=Deinococcus pimensis TaxID=309888 RepID=UPI0004AEA365|nr:metallophosphoesterase [Deinococcus pimensis]
MTRSTPVRIATVSDVHVTRTSQGALAPLLTQMAREADAIVVCGDLTDYGLAEEAQVFVRELSGVRVPVVTVLGNHDHESGTPDVVRGVLMEAGVTVLDGEACEVHGVGLAGAKGFGGGFGRWSLGAWGERPIKDFVQEAISEALKLESALARLRTRHNLAVLHYAPVAATVQGEPPEIFPFLGSSRLEEPLTRYRVSAVVHGHAHAGTFEGRLASGVPVYNVALPLMRRRDPARPFHVLTFDPDAPGEEQG